MKWPLYLVMMRHDVSLYNVLKEKKLEDPLYCKFVESFDENPFGLRTKLMAWVLWRKYRLSSGDHNTPLVDPESKRAAAVGSRLKLELELPDIIFISPYDRTWATFKGLKRGWPELNDVKWVEEERIREQGHGLALLYNDWRFFYALNPKQKRLRDLEGPYWYQFPQGEDIPKVRGRNRSWLKTLSRDFHEKKVLAISHHLNILSNMANLGRWSSDDFIRTDKEDKPVNCGVTKYVGHPELGEDGRLVLEYYNRKFF